MFDSGIGGLTVLKEVKKLLPQENFVYLGDTARVPYGNRSPYTVTRYALENALFLLTKGIKMLVIACNTSSALALSALKKRIPIPVVGVIEPAAKEAALRTRTRKIGVIGTRATIKSMAYDRAVRRIDRDVVVISRPCPLFVPIVEEGLERDEIALLTARKYLAGLGPAGIDLLVMGCTHYPVLQHAIRQVLGEGVHIVNTGFETARVVKRMLETKGLVKGGGTGKCDYFVTDSPESFTEVGSRFLEEPLKNVKLVKNLDLKDLLLSP
jgi:glutamate racemase